MKHLDKSIGLPPIGGKNIEPLTDETILLKNRHELHKTKDMEQGPIQMMGGELVTLRRVAQTDLPRFLEILHKPEVAMWWRSDDYDLKRLREEFLEDDEVSVFAVDLNGEIVGAIQYSEEPDRDYKHASIDVFIGPDYWNRGLGTDAVRTLARYLFEQRGHHRLTIDPAADNAAAIACYRKVGFKPVGILRKYERGPDGTWHDNLLMDLLAEELT